MLFVVAFSISTLQFRVVLRITSIDGGTSILSNTGDRFNVSNIKFRYRQTMTKRKQKNTEDQLNNINHFIRLNKEPKQIKVTFLKFQN